MAKLVVRLSAHAPELKELQKIVEILKKEGWEFNDYGNDNDTMMLRMSRWIEIDKSERE